MSSEDGQDPVIQANKILNKISTENDVTESGAAKEAAKIATEADVAEREDIIEFIKQKTKYTKGAVEEMVSEQRSKIERQRITVKKIEKIVPDDDREDVRWRFHSRVDDENCTPEVTSAELLGSPNTFKKQLLEAANKRVEIGDWDDWVDDVLESVEIEERGEQPITKEHTVGHQVLEEIGTMQSTADKDAWKRAGTARVYAEDGDVESGEVWIDGRAISEKCKEVKGEINPRKLRSILDDFLIGNSRQVRHDGDRFTYWRFDAEKLNLHGHEPEPPVESAEGEDI